MEKTFAGSIPRSTSSPVAAAGLGSLRTRTQQVQGRHRPPDAEHRCRSARCPRATCWCSTRRRSKRSRPKSARPASILPACPRDCSSPSMAPASEIRATLPDSYAFLEANGQKMALTFECFNSVDRTVPLMAAVGWFRFVCRNGLVLGTTTARIRQRHSSPLNLEEVSAVLKRGHGPGTSRTGHARQMAGDGDRGRGPHTVGEQAPCARRERLSRQPASTASHRPAKTASPNKARTCSRTSGPSRIRHPFLGRIRVPPTPTTSRRSSHGLRPRRGNVAERLKWRAQIPALMAGLIGKGWRSSIQKWTKCSLHAPMLSSREVWSLSNESSKSHARTRFSPS